MLLFLAYWFSVADITTIAPFAAEMSDDNVVAEKWVCSGHGILCKHMFKIRYE